MSNELIASTKNPRIVNLRKLSQRKHRRAQNRFLVDGLQLIATACDVGHRPLEVFYCREYFSGEIAPTLLQRLRKAGGVLFPVARKVMDTLSERDTPQGLIAIFPCFEASLKALLSQVTPPAFFLVLDRLQDPGNLGTLIRTADAIAATGVILIAPCVDPFDPKTVRSTMGAIFSVPLIHTQTPLVDLELLRRYHFQIAGADGVHGSVPWAAQHTAMTGSMALVLGNEARGLGNDLRPHLNQFLRLPLLGQAESLNVAVAGGVLMYHWLQQNIF